MRTLTRPHRLWPGLVGGGAAVAFMIYVVAAPHLSDDTCLESYPLQCRVVEIEGGGLVGTIVGLLASVVLIFFASASKRPKLRTVGTAIGFIVLAGVMIVGLSLSLAHSVELRYYDLSYP